MPDEPTRRVTITAPAGTLTGYIEDCSVCNEMHVTFHSKEVKE